jgi:uncharacterized protein YkwD
MKHKKLILVIFHLFILTAIVFLFLDKDSPQPKLAVNKITCEYEKNPDFYEPDFTGQQLFDAINCYRKKNGLEPLIMDQGLCSNLAQRYYDSLNPDYKYVAHGGFKEWTEDGPFKRGFNSVSENVHINGDNLNEVITGWAGSPGHNLNLLTTDRPYACTYAIRGYAFLETGAKKEQED